ncbi:hypothetical protein ES703_77227 [subsurface metagenome]
MDIYIFKVVLPRPLDYYFFARAGAALGRQGNLFGAAEVLAGY